MTGEVPSVTYNCRGEGCPEGFTVLVTEDRPDDWTCYNGEMYCAAHVPEQAR